MDLQKKKRLNGRFGCTYRSENTAKTLMSWFHCTTDLSTAPFLHSITKERNNLTATIQLSMISHHVVGLSAYLEKNNTFGKGHNTFSVGKFSHLSKIYIFNPYLHLLITRNMWCKEEIWIIWRVPLKSVLFINQNNLP